MTVLREQDHFEGFPSSGVATPVPNLFFARLLPSIERPEELIVTLYFFFAQGLKQRRPRFVSRTEMAADASLSRTLATLCHSEPERALGLGLSLAVQRHTLLKANANLRGRSEEIYLINTSTNRRAIAALEEIDLDVEEPPVINTRTQLSSIFALYEDNIGALTPLIVEELKEAEDTYPAEWLRRAVRAAVENNKRSWSYIRSILKRWQIEGPDYEKNRRDPEIDWLERRYWRGKRWRRPGG